MGKAKKFTEDEKNFILSNYPIKSIHWIKNSLGCSWYSVEKFLKDKRVFTDNNISWDKKEEDKLRLLSEDYVLEDIAKMLGRTKNAVYLKARKLGVCLIGKRNWTLEDDDELKELWGNMKVEDVAKKLKRSVDAIKIRAQRLGIVSMLDNSGVIGISQLSIILGVSRDRIFTWRKKGLKIRKLSVSNNKRYLYVNIDDLKVFLRENLCEYDSTLIDYRLFNRNPEWYEKKYLADKNGRSNLKPFVNYKLWTEREESILKKGLLAEGLNYEMLASKLGRTVNAVRYKANNLGLSYRLPKYWKGHQLKFLVDNYKTMTHKEMAIILGRSEGAVSEKCRQMGLYKRVTK